MMPYKNLAKVYSALESTSLHSKKTGILADFFVNTPAKELPMITLLCMGRVFPEWSEKEIGIASKLMIKAISKTSGLSVSKIEGLFMETGDLGLVAEKLSKQERQRTFLSKSLTLNEVLQKSQKLAELEGKKSQEEKLKLIFELLVSAGAEEAKYIVRSILGDLRIGVGEGIIRDALAKAFFTEVLWKDLLWQKQNGKKRYELLLTKNKKNIIIEDKLLGLLKKDNKVSLEKFTKDNKVSVKNKKQIQKITSLWKKKTGTDYILVRDTELGNSLKSKILDALDRAHDLTNDFSVVAKTASEEGEKGLVKLGMAPLKPIKVMLYQKSESIEDAFDTVGKPAAIEYKYDGFRVQCHKKGGEIRLFTRRLEDVTKQFPDIVKTIRNSIKSEEFIIDCEVIGIDLKTEKWLPFQNISRRIKRKYDIENMVRKIPVMLNLFDIISVNGKNLIEKPFKERRKILEEITKSKENKIELAKQLVASNEEEVQEFFDEAVEKGNEGIMMKNLEAPYKPGKRVGYGVKLKPGVETLDLVVIGADYGEGKRATWLSSFILACKDDKTGAYLAIGKMGTGIKEKDEEGVSFRELTGILEPLIISKKGKRIRVKPSLVVEVGYSEIQKSPNYASGYALRFPRLVKLRTDRRPDEIDTVEQISKLHKL